MRSGRERAGVGHLVDVTRLGRCPWAGGPPLRAWDLRHGSPRCPMQSSYGARHRCSALWQARCRVATSSAKWSSCSSATTHSVRRLRRNMPGERACPEGVWTPHMGLRRGVGAGGPRIAVVAQVSAQGVCARCHTRGATQRVHSQQSAWRVVPDPDMWVSALFLRHAFQHSSAFLR